MNISRFAVRHPAVITILMITALVFGVIALSTINQEFLPNVALPEIIVVTQYPGAGPEDVEREVTDVLEEELSAMTGLTRIRSTSRDSVSMIYLTFEDGTDLYEMLPEVRANIDQISHRLPQDIERDPTALVAGAELIPIFSFAVTSDREAHVIAEFIEESIVPPLGRIPGVSRVEFLGGQQEELFIELQLNDLESRGVSVARVHEALQYANVSIPAGVSAYRGKELPLTMTGEFSSLQEIRELVIGMRDDERIYLRDVAEVSIRYPDPEVYIDSDGEETLVVDVTKREEGDTTEIIREARSVLRGIEESYGDVMEITILQDDTALIRNALMTVVRSGLLGVAMAVFVILLFLGDIRATLIIASSLPLSIVLAFIGMRAAGQSINILSLSGLVVALGMVVDGSIVILENIYRHYHRGKDRIQASELGTRQVSQAVFASVSTSISVFVPLIALTGIIGIILSDLSLTLVFTLLGSLAVSILTVPFFTSKLLHIRKQRRRRRLMDILMALLKRSYRRTLSWCLSRGGFLFLAAVVIFIISILVLSLVGMTFIPSSDTGEFYVYMTFPEGYSLEQSRQKVHQAEALIREHVPELSGAVFFTGYAGEYERATPVKNKAYGKLMLPPVGERDRGVHEIIQQVQRLLEEQISDMEVLVENGGYDKLLALATEGAGFQIRLSAQNYNLLRQTAEEVEMLLAEDPEVYKTESTADRMRETAVGDLALHQLGMLGFTSYEAAVMTRILLHGEEVGNYRGDDRDLPIVLGSTLRGKELTEDVLEQIHLVDETGRMVSLGSVTDMRVEPSYASIDRRDRMRTITVTGHLHGDDLSGINERMQEKLGAFDFPHGVSWSIGGTAELMEDSFRDLLLLLGIAIFLVYVVMVIQFERFTQPLIVMASIPFCLIGVVFGLLLFGSTLSIVAFLGIIALGGIVVNNSIVLIDYVNMLRTEEEMPLKKAVIQGASQRLRPILMTTLTTFFGVLPLAFSRGEGAEVYASLGQAIAGGLITSTLITLLLVPVLYYLLEKRKLEMKKVIMEGGSE